MNGIDVRNTPLRAALRQIVRQLPILRSVGSAALQLWRNLTPWGAAAIGLSLLVAAPLFAVFILALSPNENIWPHLAANVLPHAVITTLLLMSGVGILTLLTGTGTAWLVNTYSFPGRKIFSWALLLPLAMPTYLIAFCYGEILDYSGTLQTTLRTLFGWKNAKDYWFPDFRSLGGAIFIMSFVLYPYVYLTARASFARQSVNLLDVARLLGASSFQSFLKIALPLARPALAAGVALALMECLNDIGAVEYLGVETLTVSVYSTWLERSNLGGAAQIASVMLLFVVLLFAMERFGRRGKSHDSSARSLSCRRRSMLSPVQGIFAALACAAPVVLGFVLPVSVLLRSALEFWHDVFSPAYFSAVTNSLKLAVLASVVSVALAIVLAYARRTVRTRLIDLPIRLASVGYAVPGTVLAVGIMIPLAGFDNMIDSFSRSTFGVSTGLIFSGSLFAIVAAYTVRFMAVSLGTIEAGFGKISPNLDAAARTLGLSQGAVLHRILLPILRPALGVAALMVFVDAMKELPATLLLRPFNFDTLATKVYTLASLDLFEEAAFAALSIVVIGLGPVLVLHQTLEKTR